MDILDPSKVTTNLFNMQVNHVATQDNWFWGFDSQNWSFYDSNKIDIKSIKMFPTSKTPDAIYENKFFLE